MGNMLTEFDPLIFASLNDLRYVRDNVLRCISCWTGLETVALHTHFVSRANLAFRTAMMFVT